MDADTWSGSRRTRQAEQGALPCSHQHLGMTEIQRGRRGPGNLFDTVVASRTYCADRHHRPWIEATGCGSPTRSHRLRQAPLPLNLVVVPRPTAALLRLDYTDTDSCTRARRGRDSSTTLYGS
ncbi:hypothetical protein [Streptomyces thioluteus]|uniref:hypothetical protein n=1 Tax=Streptomyces thioluteus TaxID=66431 RepID=UPI0031E76C05